MPENLFLALTVGGIVLLIGGLTVVAVLDSRAADTIMPVPAPNRPTVGQLAKAHTFRFLTMVATWLLIFAAFVYHPEWIRDWLRLMTHSIEALADQLPEPWGSRFEVMLKEIGGIIWIQIATAIVLFRLMIWVPFHLWRLRRERKQRDLERGELLPRIQKR